MQQLTDKELLADALLCQKHLTMMIDATAQQTDDPSLVAELGRIFTHAQQQRLAIYQAMHQRGWYNPKSIDASQVQQATRQLQQLQRTAQQQTWQGASWQPTQSASSAPWQPGQGAPAASWQSGGSNQQAQSYSYDQQNWTPGAAAAWQSPPSTR